MADAAVETALAHWGPRLIQNGVDYNDMLATIARIDTWDRWLPEWNRTADEQAEFAGEADAAGHRLTAGQAWRRASVNRHFGKFVWMVDLDLARDGHAALGRGDPYGAGPARPDRRAARGRDPRRHRAREPAPAGRGRRGRRTWC